MTDASTLNFLYPEIEPYESGDAARRRRSPALLGAERQSRRQAGRVPPRRPRSGHVGLAPSFLRPGEVPHRAVRPARVRAQHAARERSRCRPAVQHHLAPRRGHRAAAPQPGHRELAGLRRFVGQRARAGVRGDPPGCRHRTRPARDLHPAPARAGVVLRGRCVLDLPRPVGGVHRTDPGARALAHDRGVSPPAGRPRSGGTRPGSRRVVALGGLDADTPPGSRPRRDDDRAGGGDRVRPHREPLLRARRAGSASSSSSTTRRRCAASLR